MAVQPLPKDQSNKDSSPQNVPQEDTSNNDAPPRSAKNRFSVKGAIRRFPALAERRWSHVATDELTSAAIACKKVSFDLKDAILEERDRVTVIKGFIDRNDHKAALGLLMDDTDADLSYFNRMKNSMTRGRHTSGVKWRAVQEEKEEDEQRTCYWVGVNNRGIPLRCNNSCLVHPSERGVDHLGVDCLKRLYYCVYHVKHCVNVASHPDLPMKVRRQNELGLCNECYVLRNSKAPMLLSRIPGTRRKRY